MIEMITSKCKHWGPGAAHDFTRIVQFWLARALSKVQGCSLVDSKILRSASSVY